MHRHAKSRDYGEVISERLKTWRTVVLFLDVILVFVGCALLWSHVDDLFPLTLSSFRSAFNYTIFLFMATVFLNVLAFIFESLPMFITAIGLLFSYLATEMRHTDMTRHAILGTQDNGELKHAMAGWILVWVAVLSSFLTYPFIKKRPTPMDNPLFSSLTVITFIINLVGIIVLITQTKKDSPIDGYWGVFVPALIAGIYFLFAVHTNVAKHLLVACFIVGLNCFVLWWGVFVSKEYIGDYSTLTAAYALIFIAMVLFLILLITMYHMRDEYTAGPAYTSIAPVYTTTTVPVGAVSAGSSLIV